MNNILITGSKGFVGTHVVNKFVNSGYTGLEVTSKSYKKVLVKDKTTPISNSVIHIPSHKVLDLLNYKQLEDFCRKYSINSVIHLAGQVGGLEYNKKYPGELTYSNLQAGINIIEAARQFKMNRFLLVGTTCSYPAFPKTFPFIEDELFDGKSEYTNRGYGDAKRMLVSMLNEYHKQYGLNCISLIPTNLFGPGDCFDDNRSHVMAAIIKKFEFAAAHGDSSINLWGDGTCSRDFLFVKECARAIKLAFEDSLVKNEVINIGSGQEITIKELVDAIRRIGNYVGIDYKFTGEVGNGQQRRCLNIQRAKQLLNWQPETSLEDGLKQTIDWYRENHA